MLRSAFPVAFQQLVCGEVPRTANPPTEIDSPLAYRECERFIYRTYDKKPLSAPFDKLGNNATVAMVFAGRWRMQDGFSILPFAEPSDRGREIIEVYPALAKVDGRAGRRIEQLLPRGLDATSDEYDAAICAVMAAAHACGELDVELPPLVGPPPELAANAKREGWIYAPPKRWLQE